MNFDESENLRRMESDRSENLHESAGNRQTDLLSKNSTHNARPIGRDYSLHDDTVIK